MSDYKRVSTATKGYGSITPGMAKVSRIEVDRPSASEAIIPGIMVSHKKLLKSAEIQTDAKVEAKYDMSGKYDPKYKARLNHKFLRYK